MTADERIEALLNRFGQTISDLPKANSEFESAYAYHSHESIRNEAIKFGKASPKLDYIEDYACHLADVIDRMETALENATDVMACHCCMNSEPRRDDINCRCQDDSKIADWVLSGMNYFEFRYFTKYDDPEGILLVGGASGAGMKRAMEKAMKENSNEQS